MCLETGHQTALCRRVASPPARLLKRTREDFCCSTCGLLVQGDGYTNHCPACLWSRHVDVHPGDRAATCRALMEPVELRYERGEFIVVHRCTGCGTTRRCRTRADDDLSVLLDR